jgi:hypothetical protein
MAEDNKRHNQAGSNTEREGSKDGSIGNQQYTTQTGAQNNRGDNVDQEEDEFSDDLRNSGDRNSSNRKTSS